MPIQSYLASYIEMVEIVMLDTLVVATERGTGTEAKVAMMVPEVVALVINQAEMEMLVEEGNLTEAVEEGEEEVVMIMVMEVVRIETEL